MSDEYTPTTEQVRNAYSRGSGIYSASEAHAEFDRWLAEHDREQREIAWDEGNEGAMLYADEPGSENPYRKG